MQERTQFFVGLDVHKDGISIAARDASREPARFVGVVSLDVRHLLKILAKAGIPLRSAWSMKPAQRASGCIGSCGATVITARSWRPR